MRTYNTNLWFLETYLHIFSWVLMSGKNVLFKRLQLEGLSPLLQVTDLVHLSLYHGLDHLHLYQDLDHHKLLLVQLISTARLYNITLICIGKEITCVQSGSQTQTQGRISVASTEDINYSSNKPKKGNFLK